MSGPLDVLRVMREELEAELSVIGGRRHGKQLLLGRVAVLAAVEQLARDVEYVEGVLSRDPFDETQRKFAVELLRAALARLQAGSPAATPDEGGPITVMGMEINVEGECARLLTPCRMSPFHVKGRYCKVCGTVPEACEHEWVDARNEAVLSGLICRKCHALTPEPDEGGEA